MPSSPARPAPPPADFKSPRPCRAAKTTPYRVLRHGPVPLCLRNRSVAPLPRLLPCRVHRQSVLLVRFPRTKKLLRSSPGLSHPLCLPALILSPAAPFFRALPSFSPRARTPRLRASMKPPPWVFFPARTDAPRAFYQPSRKKRLFPRAHGRSPLEPPPHHLRSGRFPTHAGAPQSSACGRPRHGTGSPRARLTADSARSSFPGHARPASLFSLPRHRPYQPLRKSFCRLFSVLDQNILLVEPILISYNNY